MYLQFFCGFAFLRKIVNFANWNEYVLAGLMIAIIVKCVFEK